jgi:hypothetical protein
MMLKLGHFRKEIRNTWKVFKCDAGEGRISWSICVRNEEVLHYVKDRNILHTIN